MYRVKGNEVTYRADRREVGGAYLNCSQSFFMST